MAYDPGGGGHARPYTNPDSLYPRDPVTGRIMYEQGPRRPMLSPDEQRRVERRDREARNGGDRNRVDTPAAGGYRTPPSLLSYAQGGMVGYGDINYRVQRLLQGDITMTLDAITTGKVALDGWQDATVVIPMGEHKGYIIHLGSVGQDLYKMDREEIRKLQFMLYNAGFWEEADYDANITPTWGDREDDGQLGAALQRLMEATLRSGKSAQQIIEEKTSTFAGRIAQINEETGGAASGGASNVYVDNPFRVIPITNSTTLESTADKIAQEVFGRKATAEERVRFVAMFQNQERLLGQQQANIGQQNLLSEGENRLRNEGQDGAAGQKPGYGAAVNPGGGLIYPILGATVADSEWQDSFLASRGDHIHYSIDINHKGKPQAGRGMSIVAAMGGTVVKSKNSVAPGQRAPTTVATT